MPTFSNFSLLALAAFAASTFAQSDYARIPLPSDLVPSGTQPAAAAVVCFLEGPAADEAGNVFFSDIAGNRILKMNPKGDISLFRFDSGRTNGNCFDAKGNLVSCEGGEQGPGRRRIVHIALADSKDISTESIGEGDARRVVISLKRTGR